jgi:hypothetical protein
MRKSAVERQTQYIELTARSLQKAATPGPVPPDT